MNKLPIFLRDARIKKGLTQKELAKKFKWDSAQFVSNWERGLARPPIKVAKKLCKILDIDEDRLSDLFLQSIIDEIRKKWDQA
jgi:transcriptional regulator with XRE-family HTH domain